MRRVRRSSDVFSPTDEAEGPPAPFETAQAPLELTEHERSVLISWAQGDHSIARRAKVVLAYADHANVTTISRSAGWSRVSIYHWIDRFRNGRLQGIFRNAIECLTPAQAQELEHAKNGADSRFAKRAAFLLEVAQSPDLRRAASEFGISLNAARLWLRAFHRAGIEGLAHPKAARSRKFPKLSGEELALLRQWSEAGRSFSRRAAVILALCQGESVDAVATRQQISKASVSVWRNRFIRDGLDAIAPKHRMTLGPGEREAIQKLQSDGSPVIAKRASVLLDLFDSGDVFATARRHDVSLTAVRNWKRAFRERGVAGLCNPKLARPPRPRPRAGPLVLPIQLRVDLQVETAAGIVKASGISTRFSSRQLTISLNHEAAELVQSSDGCRVSAKVHWPAQTPDGAQLRLRLLGTIVPSTAPEMRIAIRTFTFIPAIAT